MKDNKTLQTLDLANQLMKNWTQSGNFDLELNRLRRDGKAEAELRPSSLSLRIPQKA